MKCKIEIRANDAAFDKWEVVINGQVLAAGQTEPEAIRIAATIKSVLDYLECPDCAAKDERITVLEAFVRLFDAWWGTNPNTDDEDDAETAIFAYRKRVGKVG